jgi:hypothetical protein
MTSHTPKPFEGKTCFVITPIGGDGTSIRREADGIVDEVLIPVLEGQLGFEVKVAHRIEVTGSISQQVIRGVMESDLAICNLTTLNPNVMYELALRHAARLPVVTIASDSTNLPFDVAEDRVIFYQNDIMGAHKLKDNLKPMVINCMSDDEPDNPVYRAIKASKVIKEVHATGGSEAAIFDAIDQLNQRMDKFSSNHSGPSKFINRTQNISLVIQDRNVYTSNDHQRIDLSQVIWELVSDITNAVEVEKLEEENIYKANIECDIASEISEAKLLKKLSKGLGEFNFLVINYKHT